MTQPTGADKEIRLPTTQASSPAVSTFKGFRPPTSNTTYTPNQFFDVVIPHFSRGVVRIVGYLIRKTLGWCDANGNPQEEEIEASYTELESKAGISRDMIRAALDEAIAANIIECVREGRPKLAHDAGQTALYALRWSALPYTTKPSDFQGFFEGDGNRTDIPNEFFDVVIPNEPLSVIKVVGSVIRHSIGFQSKHGRRRQQVALSFQHIQNYACIGSRSDLAKAVRTALERNYIVRVVDGVFSHRDDERCAATYALCWSDSLIGQKTVPAPNQSENQTSIGQISAPAYRSENRTTLETKPENETAKQQQAAIPSPAYAKLIAEGFDANVAAELSKAHSLEDIEKQIAWLPQRAPYRNKLGLLRTAIEGKWPEPAKLQSPEVQNTNGREFARHFFAAFGGNKGEPVAEPSTRDSEVAEVFVARLLKISPTPEKIGSWGRALAARALQQQSPLPSLILAIRQCGDALLAALENKVRNDRQDALRHARDSHYAQYLTTYQRWLADEEWDCRTNRRDNYAAFERKRNADRERLHVTNSSMNRSLLAIFDQESSRLSDFRQFFSLPDFWQWDSTINSEPFKPRT